MRTAEDVRQLEYLHKLYQEYYAGKVKQDRQVCARCGKPRVLGVRGRAKIYCKKCRRNIK